MASEIDHHLAGSPESHNRGGRHAQRVVAIIPAHNEEVTLAGTIRSLLAQTRPPERIVVASDNSTDSTVAIASSWGSKVEVFETQGNVNRKAGALNQALEWVEEPDDTRILIVDADSRLVPGFLERALKAAEQPKVGAVGGVFVGDDRNGLLGAVQGLEYTRYAREIGRLGGNARVLTGTATLIRRGTL